MGNNINNLTATTRKPDRPVFGPSLLLTNTMSLAPKIDEITICVTDLKPDIACFTETWFHNGINENCVKIPGYNLIYKNRMYGTHGGVCTYIRNSISYKNLDQFDNESFEVLWVQIRPNRLPRGVPSIVIGIVYHPPNADNKAMTSLGTEMVCFSVLVPSTATVLNLLLIYSSVISLNCSAVHRAFIPQSSISNKYLSHADSNICNFSL